MKIPLSSPDIVESDIQAVTDVLRTSRLSLGPSLQMFEESLVRYLDVPHALAVSSGTGALHLCLQALGVEAGDEVIVPSFAFVAVANAVLYRNAIPVFVDIDPCTLNVDASNLEQAITPKTRGIIVVHTFGYPADLDEILAMARRHELFVLEDACEALGAEYHRKKCGTLGDAGVFGFYPNKQITTGEGGAIVTRDPHIARMVRGLRNQGRLDPEGYAEHGHLGYNYRLSDINCALGRSQIERLESILLRRETIAQVYAEKLRSNPHVLAPPLVAPGCRISWFAYVVRLRQDFTREDRDWIVEQMASQGIACGRYFVPIHQQPLYGRVRWRAGDLRITEWCAGRSLALPFFNRLEHAEIQEVCDALALVLWQCELRKGHLDRAPGNA